jgi:4-hydroxythreonine-4-phosphate dehydrogenase
MSPVFIFMLTRNDCTIPDAFERVEEALEAGVRHIGFKDVGLPLADLARLADRIRAAGGRVYLEVVSLDEASEVASAKSAVALKVDVLMGGTRPAAVTAVIAGSGIEYFPFPGRIVGHPSALTGRAEEIVESAKAMAAMDGVHGLDLLAYRFSGDVEDLISRVCASVAKPVVVAGSIDRAERIQAVASAGAWGFTVGTAALDAAFDPQRTALGMQLAAIQACVAHADRPRLAAST